MGDPVASGAQWAEHVIQLFSSHHTLLKVPALFTDWSLYVHLQESQLFLEFEMPLHLVCNTCNQGEKGTNTWERSWKQTKNILRKRWRTCSYCCHSVLDWKKTSLLMYFHFPISFYYEEDSSTGIHFEKFRNIINIAQNSQGKVTS